MTHLEPGDAVDFAQGLVREARRAEIDRHLAECPGCQAMVLEVVRTSFSAMPGRSAPAPVQVGRYVLLGIAGAGAMGTVFRAYDPQLDRRVALKLLHVTAGQDALLNEARAMAKVAHPNLLTVYDAGQADQQLFLAMDLVEGQTLRQWMSSPREPPEVLDVFLQAAAGLSAAHRAGLIHRDFKPENVLLDADGRARVADFGLALAHGHQEGGRQLVGTPAYMAPEVLVGEPATPASDQFSFAVTLVEALSGRRPFEGLTVDALREATRRPPVLPASVPRRLRRPLSRALSVPAAQRFSSMDALAAALRPPSRVVAWLSAVALAASLVVGVSVTVSSMRRDCSGVEAPIAAVWSPSQRSQLKTSLSAAGLPFSAFVAQKTEENLDAWVGRWKQMRVEACESNRLRGTQSDAVFSLRSRCLDRRLGDLTALVRALSSSTPAVAERAVQASLGLEGLEACADVDGLSAPVSLPSAETAAVIEGLSPEVSSLQALLLSGQYAMGVEQAPTVVAKAAAARWAPLEAEVLHLTGLLQGRAGDRDRAAQSLLAAALAAERGHDDVRRLSVMIDLAALVGLELSREQDGLRWLESGNAIADRLGGDRPLERGRLKNVSSALDKRARRFDLALAEAREAVALLEAAGPAGEGSMGSALNNLGLSLTDVGKADEAIAVLQRALARTERVNGPQHPQLIPPLTSLATALATSGRYAEAEAQYRRAREVAEASFGEHHPWTVKAFNNHAMGLMGVGRIAEAKALATRAVAERRALGPHPSLWSNLATLADAKRLSADCDGAVRDSLDILAAGDGVDQEVRATVELGLAECWLDRGDAPRALEALARISEVLKSAHSIEGARRRLVVQAVAWSQTGRAAEALASLDAAVFAPPLDAAEVAFARARVLQSMGKGAEAVAAAARASELFALAGDAKVPSQRIAAWRATLK